MSQTFKKSNDSDLHQFGGCDRTLNHYRTVGLELREVEKLRIGHSGSARLQREFREAVCFVPVEVLESYLEDLLDLDASDESLFIGRSSIVSWLPTIALSGLVTALGFGLYYASSGGPLFRSVALTLFMAAPFFILWRISPYGGLARRLGFAKLLSGEIARRRGRGQDTSWNTRQFLGELLRPTSSESAKGAALIMHPKNFENN